MIEELERQLESMKDYHDLRRMVERLTKELADKTKECEALEGPQICCRNSIYIVFSRDM
jgi:predicted RNase H-like nuclease (RuvC/YqgF family)